VIGIRRITLSSEYESGSLAFPGSPNSRIRVDRHDLIFRTSFEVLEKTADIV
jgi:hypothetical protein